jgi:hypothetical protein
MTGRIIPKILWRQIQRQVNRSCDCSRLRKPEKVLGSSEKVRHLGAFRHLVPTTAVLVGMVSAADDTPIPETSRGGLTIEARIEPC